MNFISTRNTAPAATLSQAIAAGLAPDGGLYVPDVLPAPRELAAGDDIASTAATLLAPFFAGDALAGELAAICREAFDFPAPLRPLGTPDDHVLELFHGPTAAFKDFGARFLAASMARVRRNEHAPLTILVATSGDTGAAVAAAFHRQPGLRVVVLYPDGRVSPRQAHQLGCFGDNIVALRVAGSFDDCQALVKRALNDAELQAQAPLSSANSISLGRLLPQMSYYAHAALRHRAATGRTLNLVVPTGNLGNALACLLAKRMGLPIGNIVLASNANTVLPDFFAGGDYAPQPSIATLANAMDVGAPSNFERLQYLYPDAAELRATLRAEAVSDDQIRAAIVRVRDGRSHVVCPHTACAADVLDRLRARGASGDWAAVATAHPAKFPETVEAATGETPVMPRTAAHLAGKPERFDRLPADAETIKAYVRAFAEG